MQSETLILFSPFRLDVLNEQLWRDNELVAVRPKPFAVLAYLAAHAGRLVPAAELRKAVWPHTYVGEGLLRGYIREVRSVLGDNPEAPRFIETVVRRGYRFIGKVVSSSESVPAPNLQIPTLTLVGRDIELAQLDGWLVKALNGTRQVVFVTGEPGIGKTTVVDTFLAQAAVRGELWTARGQCVEHYGAGEAYLPLLEALGQLCRQPGGEQVIPLLSRYAPTWLVQLPALLSDTELEAVRHRVQGATQERMLRELAEALEVLTATTPLVLVLEDLHWSDYSTLDLLALLGQRRGPARLLLLGTYRPADVIVSGHPLRAIKQELQVHRRCEELALGFLTAAEVTQYLAVRFPQQQLPPELGRAMQQSTEGNPLFMVNVVDYWMSQKVLVETAGQWQLTARIEDLAAGVPESLRQMIEKQLERLTAEEQYLLQVASVAGEEFSAASVAVGEEAQTEQVEEGYEGLAARGQFVRFRSMETLPNGAVTGRYRFLHAIYQQTLYERLTAIRRVRLHRAVGEKMERLWGAQAYEHASVLAVHFEFGQAYPQAMPYLWLAAENARRKHAYHETITLLTKSLDLLPTQPDTPERRRQELALLVSLGVPLLMTRGYAAPEVEQAYARARELCQELGESPQLLPALAGLFRFYFVRAEFQTAQELAAQVLRLAQSTSDAVVFLIAHSLLAVPLLSLGEFTAAREQFEKGITLYDPQQHRFMASLYGDDPGIICFALGALTLWFLGYPDQALRNSQQALALAQDLALPYNLAFALDLATWVHFYRGERQAAQVCIEALLPLVSEQGFQFFAAESLILQGWVLAEQGQGTEGLMQMRPGLAAYRATGAEMSRPTHLGQLAKAYGKVGQVEEGLATLAEAFALVDKTGERCLDAELYRLKGEFVLQSKVQSPRSTVKKSSEFKVQSPKSKVAASQSTSRSPQLEMEAETCFLKAIEIARGQQAKSLELRAGTSLARLWRQQGKKKAARQMLAEIYGWFTEGFDTKDLQEAKALFQQLSH